MRTSVDIADESRIGFYQLKSQSFLRRDITHQKSDQWCEKTFNETSIKKSSTFMHFVKKQRKRQKIAIIIYRDMKFLISDWAEKKISWMILAIADLNV